MDALLLLLFKPQVWPSKAMNDATRRKSSFSLSCEHFTIRPSQKRYGKRYEGQTHSIITS
jgi:hypothetical protein